MLILHRLFWPGLLTDHFLDSWDNSAVGSRGELVAQPLPSATRPVSLLKQFPSDVVGPDTHSHQLTIE